jgi:hypothetical protein
MVTLHDALTYHDLGLSIIPINPSSKKAACRWKAFQKSRPSESQIRQWFGDDDRHAIAAVMGEVSGGVICRDFDDLSAYERWSRQYPDLSCTLPTADTPRPGKHVYCRADVNQIRQVSKSGGAILTFTDGELRGDGGYCLLPPSTLPSKPQYTWNGLGRHQVPAEFPLVDLHDAGFIPCDRDSGADRDDSRHVMSPLGTPQCTPSSLSHGDIEMAIASCLPTGAGQRHKMLFKLARELKAVPELADAPVAALKTYVKRWHAAARAVIHTKEFEESWFDFAEGWSKVKYPAGKGPMDMIYETVTDTNMPDAASCYEKKKVRMLVGLCRELQRAAGSGAFFLSSRTAGGLLGVDHATAARWLRGFAIDEILQVGSRSSGKASRYRYLPTL